MPSSELQESNGYSVALAIERMLVALGPAGKRDWELLDTVLAGHLGLGELYDAYRRDELDHLRHRLDDVDLADHLAPWQAWLTDRIAADTAGHYLAYVRTLMPVGAPFWRSAFTGAVVARWIATRTSLPQKRASAAKGSRRILHLTKPITGSTRRKYLAAVQSFTKYSMEVGVLTSNPLRDVHRA